MKQYLLYRQVQSRLQEHARKCGSPFSFYEAVSELWRENRFTSARELPVPPFDKWDTSRVDDFEYYMGLAPVDLALFPIDKLSQNSAALASRQIPELNGLPMMTAKYQSMGIHFHDAFEIQYVLKGKARLHLNENSRLFSEGELCILAPHFHHDVVPEDDAIVVSFTFWEHTIENTLFKVLKGENIIADFFRTNLSRRRQGYMLFSLPPTESTLRVIRSIFYEGYVHEAYSRELCVSYIEIFFSYLLRHHSNGQSHSYTEKETGESSILAILKYIQDHYRETSLNKVSGLFHYEPSYLGKKIKAQTGKKYTDIISELRIREARALLHGTGDSIEDIAEACGFKSAVHFSRSFKEAVGMPPRAYRKVNLSGSGALSPPGSFGL